MIDPPQLGRIVIPATHVWALMMPAPLGRLVCTELQRRAADLGPIVSHPRSNRWSYLVRSDLPDDDRLFAELLRLNVSVVREGGTIALPSPADECVEFRRWVEPPRCIYRPSGLVVIDAIRACVGPGRHRAVARG